MRLSTNSKLLFLVAGILFFVGASVKADSVQIVELSSRWTLTNKNQTIEKNNLRVPSGVYSALYGEDVLLSYNDVNMRWIANDSWTYKREFSVDLKELNNIGFANLTFHGIDTIAEIRLNHDFVGRTDNMFVRYSYDVTKLLQENNLLEVEIKSPIAAALAKANELKAMGKPVPPECPPDRYNGECHMNMLRKMQASFAWDWGLAAPSMGIWKPVALEYYDVALIRDIDVTPIKNTTHWKMRVRVFIDAAGGKDFYAKLTFFAVDLLNHAVSVYDYSEKPLSFKSPVIQFEVAVPVDEVILWWPNGYGEQKLYPLHFTLNAWTDPSGPNLRRKTISQKSIHIGFRTIELVEDETENGNTFLFRVNGEEIFMKGTNYIPSHILPDLSANEKRLRNLLYSAKDAHMNMIRVWGGGVYESDAFYSLADRFGILIWQDMMFACAMYPATEDFLASVRTEVVQNALRLIHHPSVAIFATNNENEVALATNWYQTLSDQHRFEVEYRELYVATVLHELKIIGDSSRPTPLVSSPSNGRESQKDNYISENPQDPNYGDVHFYDFLRDGWDPKIYPRPRFSSEYGFQSLPAMESWRRVLAEGDDLQHLISHREHHPAGLFAITTLVRQHLPLPAFGEYTEALIYMSQISQAMGTKIETELYRSLRDTEHRTMGALYWQLNDVWVAPSWSSIDFYGNYKILHHWAKDFMAPTAIFALYDNDKNSVNITLACDELKVDTEKLTVTSNVYLWSDLFPKSSKTWPATLKPNGVHYDKVISVNELFSSEFTLKNSFAEFLLVRDSELVSRTFYFPTSIKNAEGVSDPNVSIEISSRHCSENQGAVVYNSFSLTITVTHPAIFVYLEVTNEHVVQYKLSHNGFMQTVPVQVIFLEFENENCINLTRNDINVLTINQYML